jgi:signal transduction histidine kinase
MSVDARLSPRVLTALESVGQSAHLCALYEREEEQVAAAVAFFRIALARGEWCVYLGEDGGGTTLLGALRSEGIAADEALRAGKLALRSRAETYLEDGHFDPQRMAKWIADQIRAATGAGFAGLRLVGEMTWALGLHAGVGRLAEYEAKLNDVVRGQPATLLCQYDRSRFSTPVIREMLATHPQVVVGETVCKNPYYVPPEKFLSADWPEREVEWLLDSFRDLQRAEDALHESEKRYRMLSRYLFEVQESERRSLARELHDQLGQDLLAIKMNLMAIRGAVRSPALATRAEEAMAILDRTMHKVQSLAFELRPPTLDDLGLVPALDRLLAEHAQRAGYRAQFSAQPKDLRAPPEIETACFRIVEEALANIARHAKAKNVEVALTADEHALEVMVRDDGAGFDVKELRSELGLVGMEERASLVGGRLEIQSQPGRGTTIHAWFPLRAVG